MKSRGQAILCAGCQHAAGFLGGEDALLTEDIAEPGEPSLGGGGDDLLANDVEIAVPLLAILGWSLMCREKRRYQVDRMLLGGVANCPQLLQLVVEGQTVATLGFGGSRAMGEHQIEAVQDSLGEVRFRSLTRGAHGGQDSPALGGDLHVGPTRQALSELCLATARPGQVGVRVHEPRHQGAAIGIESLDRLQGAHLALDLVPRPDACDLSVSAQDFHP